MYILFLEVFAKGWHCMNNQTLALKALSKYVNTAILIRLNEYEGSVAAKLEKVIEGDLVLCRNLVGIDIPDHSRFDFSKSFIAIVAPSFEGKTQFAFVLKHVRPF